METNIELTQIEAKFCQLINGEKLTFLVGAGCSIEEPTCLPAAMLTMKMLVNYFCIEKEREYLLQKIDQGKIRFEAFIENLQDNIDTNLKIIEFYGLSRFPNILHFYLSKMIETGHFVMTTNFDYLIELALIENKIDKDRIIPVISKTDYEKYSNPEELVQKGYKPVYKVHGSVKNIITNENTRESLITTLKALGKNKEGINVFQIEPFKHQLFENISKRRTFLIMGYSGGDDFDIVPTLKLLKDLHQIIWITHINNNKESETFFEIKSKSFNSSMVHTILSEIKNFNPNIKIYEFRLNTSKLIRKIIDFKPEISKKNFDQNLDQWISVQFPKIEKLIKYKITIKVLNELNDLKRALSISKEMLGHCIAVKDSQGIIDASMLIGEYYFKQGKFKRSIAYLEDLLPIVEEKANQEVNSIHSIGDAWLSKGRVDKAVVDHFESDLTQVKETGWSIRLGRINTNIGKLYKEKREYDKATSFIGMAWMQACTMDDHVTEIESLINLGEIFELQFQYDEALEKYLEALEIAEEHGYLKYKSVLLGMLGQLYYYKGNISDANSYFQEALLIANKLGDYINKVYILCNLGNLLHSRGETEQANDYFNELLDTYVKVEGRFKDDTALLIEAGLNLYTKKSIDETLSYLQKALDIARRDKSENEQVMILCIEAENLAGGNRIQEGIRKLNKALAIAIKSKNPNHHSMILKTVFSFVSDRDNIENKFNHEGKLLAIIDQVANCKAKLYTLFEIGETLRKNGQLDEALEYYKSALKLSGRKEIIKVKHDFSDNIIFFHRSLQHAKKEKNQTLLTLNPELTIIDDKIASAHEIYLNIGKILFEKGHFEEALNNFQNGYDIAKKEKDINFQANFLLSFSHLFIAKKNVSKSLLYLKQFTQLMEKFNSSKGRETVLGLLNYYLTNKECISEVLLNAREILNIIKLVKKCHNKISMLINFGGFLFQLEAYEEALEYLSEALQLAEEEENIKLKNDILNNKTVILNKYGYSLISINKIDEGISYIYKAADIFEELKNYHNKTITIYRLFAHLVLNNHYKEARECADKALDAIFKTEDLEDRDDMLKSISRFLI